MSCCIKTSRLPNSRSPPHIEVSSANRLIKRCSVAVGKSLMNNKNSTRLRTEPWGTPILHSVYFIRRIGSICCTWGQYSLTFTSIIRFYFFFVALLDDIPILYLSPNDSISPHPTQTPYQPRKPFL